MHVVDNVFCQVYVCVCVRACVSVTVRVQLGHRQVKVKVPDVKVSTLSEIRSWSRKPLTMSSSMVHFTMQSLNDRINLQ